MYAQQYSTPCIHIKRQINTIAVDHIYTYEILNIKGNETETIISRDGELYFSIINLQIYVEYFNFFFLPFMVCGLEKTVSI